MDSVSDFESGGCGFESRIAYSFAPNTTSSTNVNPPCCLRLRTNKNDTRSFISTTRTAPITVCSTNINMFVLPLSRDHRRCRLCFVPPHSWTTQYQKQRHTSSHTVAMRPIFLLRVQMFILFAHKRNGFETKIIDQHSEITVSFTIECKRAKERRGEQSSSEVWCCALRPLKQCLAFDRYCAWNKELWCRNHHAHTLHLLKCSNLEAASLPVWKSIELFVNAKQAFGWSQSANLLDVLVLCKVFPFLYVVQIVL
jgi:hypothetical protein